MIPESILWFLMGAIFVLVSASAWVWTQDLGLVMRWWKWLLVLLWYGLLLLTVGASLTLVGEKESGAALRVLGFLGVPTIILGVGLGRLILSGRRNRSQGND